MMMVVVVMGALGCFGWGEGWRGMMTVLRVERGWRDALLE